MPTDEVRDSNGDLVAYTTKPGCVYGEVLGVKIEKRMERIESNVGDTRMDIQKLSANIDQIKSQVAGICSLTRELTNEVRLYAKVQTEANHEKRLQKVEGQVKFLQGAAKIILWVVSPAIAIGTIILGFFKLTGGK